MLARRYYNVICPELARQFNPFLMAKRKTDKELRELALELHGPNPGNKRRYRTLHGELRTTAQQYGKDLASIIHMRYVQGHTIPEIVKMTGLSEWTVKDMMKPFRAIMDNPDAVKQYRLNEEFLLDGVKALLVQGMAEQLSDPERRKSLDLSRLTYGFGIIFDKNRLVKGESTANVSMSLSELVRKAHESLDEIKVEAVEEAQVVN